MTRPKKYKPVYLRSYQEGSLQDKITHINKIHRECTACPHRCMTDRTRSNSGKCRSGDLPMVSSYCAHFGEEAPLTGYCGSGTIFFGNCNLACIFCQNYDISQCGAGQEVSHFTLAKIMVELQSRGCHNINFVSPSHMVHAILNSLPEAIEMGLNIPLVYNSGGYDAVSTIKLMDGIIDIFMPDLKYMDNSISVELSGIEDYVENASNAIREMFRQVGDLKIDENGIARRGLIIRHLILPGNIAKTDKVIDFVHALSPGTYFNLMDQYHPSFKAFNYPRINRRLTLTEYEEARNYAVRIGLNRLAS